MKKNCSQKNKFVHRFWFNIFFILPLSLKHYFWNCIVSWFLLKSLNSKRCIFRFMHFFGISGKNDSTYLRKRIFLEIDTCNLEKHTFGLLHLFLRMKFYFFWIFDKLSLFLDHFFFLFTKQNFRWIGVFFQKLFFTKLSPCMRFSCFVFLILAFNIY